MKKKRKEKIKKDSTRLEGEAYLMGRIGSVIQTRDGNWLCELGIWLHLWLGQRYAEMREVAD